MKELCLCGYLCDKPESMKAHRKVCPVEAGVSNAREDERRRRLLRKYDINPQDFQVFLKLLAKRYQS